MPRVAVVGNGNVAMDAARILLRTPAELEKTDLAAHALEVLRASRVREVFVLGRRGPVQAAFTHIELKEFGELEAVDPVIDPHELADCGWSETGGNSAADKNLRILQTFAMQRPTGKEKKLHLRFLVSPTEVICDSAGRVSGLALERNRLETRAGGTIASGTGEIEVLDVGMVLPAIGFAAERIAGVPYDAKAMIIANEEGRVVDPVSRAVIGQEYVVGWARSGAQGLIGAHKAASARVVELMTADGIGLDGLELPEPEAIVSLLRGRGVQVVSFDDWKQLDEVEVDRGARRGAPRDKFVALSAMLEVLAQH